jgi:hypothetical protein
MLERLRRLWPQNTKGGAARCAKRDTDIRRRLTVASRRDQHLRQRLIKGRMTARANWPHYLDRGLVVEEGHREKGRRNVGASGVNRVANLGDVHAEASEHLAGQTFDVEHAEQNVGAGHLWLLVFAGESARSFQGPLCPRRERQCIAGRRSGVCSRRFGHLVARRGEMCTGRSEQVGRLTVIVREKSEKQMLGANPWMIEPSCLHPRQ